MFRFIKNIVVKGFLIFLVLEILVRFFHLYNDMPDWFLADDKTYKRVPGQEGYAVFGNRKQNVSAYRINQSGYNSFREFNPTEEGIEVAILGDSFIEGLHQDYHNSIGKKIEDELKHVHVYEYGHSNFDLADQMFLVQANEEIFSKIDFIIFEFKYFDDLLRAEYSIENRRVVFPLLRYSKLLTYFLDIGLVDSVKKVLRNFNIGQTPRKVDKTDKDSLFLNNFKSLISKYGIDKTKSAFLLNSNDTNVEFLGFLKNNGIPIIDYGDGLKKSCDSPTTLIFDRHWNDNGRNIVAEAIIDFFKRKPIK
ncbi:MAG: hypothetical protein AAGC43_00630 [Bacteroidota bacterium]